MCVCCQLFGWKRLLHLGFVALVLLLAACSNGTAVQTPQPLPSPTIKPTVALSPTSGTTQACPAQLKSVPDCQTPYSMRVAYDMESLIASGMAGAGQTVVDIVSFGSPTLQADMDVFDRQFGLPPITLQIKAPIGTVPFNPNNEDMAGWAEETTLDVEIIHALAPAAGIVVLTSPVDETEGVIGLPQFLQLEQYAVSHKLGQIFSQSYVASETTLANSQGRQLVQKYTQFYQQITTQDGWTVVTGSGDHGATDYDNLAATALSAVPIVNFPADVPWVTAVGGTNLLSTHSTTVDETAWSGSGGGFSRFFSEPDYQKTLPAGLQAQLKGRRGIPDVAANANPSTAMAIYFGGQWQQVGGTSAATPTWAAIIAVADQMAGHALGSINPGLYKLAASGTAARDFRDITSGNNTFSESGLTVQGYRAGPGWDAVTGLGTPLGSHLLPDLISALRS